MEFAHEGIQRVKQLFIAEWILANVSSPIDDPKLAMAPWLQPQYFDVSFISTFPVHAYIYVELSHALLYHICI